MAVVLVTGSGGLVGSEAVSFFSKKKFDVVGIDNNMRSYFFGEEASTNWNVIRLKKDIPCYRHLDIDIRNYHELSAVFSQYGSDIVAVIHCAAQPSHDWASRDPITDFQVNANGTLNLLELSRQYCSEAVFVFTSTNKVYGDTPNSLPFLEKELRWELNQSHPYYPEGIDESMSVDNSKHSLFGASKLSADIVVQEYGRYYGMKTVCFRGGCLTGSNHSGTELHGFLAYLMKCSITRDKYYIFGYKGKQVRDNIHAYDLVNMFWKFFQNPKIGEVYNAGGSRFSNCSILEAISLCEEKSGNKLQWEYCEENRIGDHIWWVSDIRKFKSHFPDWEYTYSLDDIITEIYDQMRGRL